METTAGLSSPTAQGESRPYTSRLSGLHRLPLQERIDLISALAGLDAAEVAVLTGQGVEVLERANASIENAIGTIGVPLGVGTNLIVNGREVLVPMAIEEPSVIAALSNGALLVRETGGVQASADASEMIGQIQLYDVDDPVAARARLLEHRDALLALANGTMPRMVSRGGGARDLQVRLIDTAIGTMLVIHLAVDVCDAMGANVVNSAAEALAPECERLTGGQVGLRVLSNLATRRVARATCRVPAARLAPESMDPEEAARALLAAQALADADPYRAATHNKGIMNGIDAVALATGNDWRAIEAGAHAWAGRTGAYKPLSTWVRDPDGDLVGSIMLPLAVGTQGGAVRAHAMAPIALKIMRVERAQELAEVMAAVGLVQNLAALKALTTEGIQRGHMRLHARQVALAAGAVGPEVDDLAERLTTAGAISLSRAQALLQELRG